MVRDYLAAQAPAAGFFRGDPFSLDTYRARIGELQTRFGPGERKAAAAALHPSSRGAAERLARFVNEGGVVVTTGQQTGLFTGPLFTVHKILGTIALADRLEEALGLVVLPVFWSASEDHDWAEVNHTWMLDGSGKLRRLELFSGDPRPLPMNDRLLTPDVESVLAAVRQTLQAEPHADEYLRLLRDAYRPGRSVASAFRETIERTFAPWDLLTADAADPVLKSASAPVLEAALTAVAEQELVLQRTATRLREAGYHVQVKLLSGAANLFLHTEAGRERLHKSAAGWRTRGSRQQYEHGRLLSLSQEDPWHLSPNALLRPVVENSVFPVVAYVGGPGEISYFGQIGDFFGCFGMAPPIVFPRPSVLFVPPGVRTTLERLNLGVEDLNVPESELATLTVRRLMAPAVVDALATLRESVVDGYREFLQSIADADGLFEREVGSLRNRALDDVSRVERKLVRHTKARENAQLRELAVARATLRPQRTPQERVLNVFPFLARYGPTLLQRTAAAMRNSLAQSLA